MQDPTPHPSIHSGLSMLGESFLRFNFFILIITVVDTVETTVYRRYLNEIASGQPGGQTVDKCGVVGNDKICKQSYAQLG